jgi:hypothetical protein
MAFFMSHDLLSYLLGLTAAMLMGLAKTGFPGASLPAVLLMVEAFPGDARASVSAIVPGLLVGDVLAVVWYRRHADWSRLVALFPYVAVGMVPGIVVLACAAGNQLRPVLGWLVAGLLVLELGRRSFRWEHLPSQWWFVGSMGVLAGFGTMVGNAAGPVMSIYLISRGMLKEQFIGTSAWFFLLVNLSKVPVMAGMGMFTADTLQFGLVVAMAVPLGAALGVWVLRRISQRSFDMFALILAGVAALRLILAANAVR